MKKAQLLWVTAVLGLAVVAHGQKEREDSHRLSLLPSLHLYNQCPSRSYGVGGVSTHWKSL